MPTAIEVVEIRTRAEPGVTVATAIREAVMLALERNEEVVLEFNDTPIRITPSALLDIYHKAYHDAQGGNE